MRKSLFVCLALGAVLLEGPLFLCAAPLKVLSATPKGSLQDFARQAVSVTFNQSVVALSQASQLSSEDCPLSITPAVEGVCRYAGTQTVLFEPTQNWPAATAFTVRLPAGFTSAVSGEKLAAPYTFSFTSARPQVRQVYPRDNEHWISLTPTLYAGFSMPMDAKAVKDNVYLLSTDGQRIDVSAREILEQEWEKQFSFLPSAQYVLAFTPKNELKKGERYTLVLAQGLKAAQGTLGLAKEYKSQFVTVPELSVLGVKEAGCLPYTPQIRFSSPVRMSELIRSVKVTPAEAVKNLSAEEMDLLGYEYVIKPFAELSEQARNNFLSSFQLTAAEQKNGSAFFATNLPFLTLRPHQSVTVTLDKNLTDIYGGRLGHDYTVTFTNNGYCPAVDFSGGFGVLESYLPPRLPIEIMNTPSLPVQATRFNKENFIPFWVDRDKSFCAKKPLSSLTYDGEYIFKDIKDQSVKTYFDLKRFNPTAQDSLIVSQVKLKRNGSDCWITSTDNLTDVGLSFKVSPQNILLWATSLQTGEPLPNLAVELRDNTNTILWSGSTDMNGLARAPGWKQLDTPAPSWGAPKLYAFISSAGGDGFISTELNEGLEPWRFNLNYTYSPQQEAWQTFLFTERGIYRPGEKVYLQGILRQWKNNTWRIPKQAQGKLVISDSSGASVWSKTLDIYPNAGTFEAEFNLPASARAGDWEVSFTPQIAQEKDLSSAYASFKVEAATPAAFHLTLQSDKKDYISGEEARFTSAAQYQFGTPLNQAPAKWTLRREMAWFEPAEFKGYTFTPYFLREGEYKEDGKLLAQTSSTTDAQGLSSFKVRLPQVKAPARVFAEVGVESPARQELFERKSVLLHPADFYIGAKVADGYARAGKPVSAELIAVTPQGQRTQATATAQIQKKQWHSVRKVGLSGRLEWVSEQEVVDISSQRVEIGEKGTVFSFTPQQSGNYYITFFAVDDAGRPVRGGFDVMVYGKDGPTWAQQDEDILPLKPNKNTYLPGDTARIHVESPYTEALALVTVEREGILDAWTTSLKGGADYIDVPIKGNYLPNVYVGVTLIQGRTAAGIDAKGVDLGKPHVKMGYTNLPVEVSSKKITLSLRTNKEHYRPADEVTVKISTKLGRKNVPAQVTLFVVDEGVLALTDYKTPDPLRAFYNERPLSVFTADNRSYVIGQRNFGQKGENRGGGGSAYAKLGGVDLRNHFSFVPYYQTRIMTNDKGQAEVKFKLPDNLTRFRVMAIAVREEEFGSAQAQFDVSKPLSITANLPAIARESDSFLCRAIVYNYADKKGLLTLHAAAVGAVELDTISSRTLTVPVGQAQAVQWPCKAVRTGTARIGFSVKGRDESDGVSTTLEVVPVEKAQTLALYHVTDSQQEELLEKPAHVKSNVANQVAVSLASSGLINLKGAIDYLITYPYDCLEQQMSKIRPVVTSAQLLRDFKLADVTQLTKQAQNVLDNLPAYQHTSGGFGYWKNDSPDPYVTAYTLETAYQAKQAGFTVPQETLQKAADWLEKAFNKNQHVAFEYALYETYITRAYSAYVLGLYGKSVYSLFNTLYAQRSSMPLPGVAYLLKTAQLTNRADSIKRPLAQQLLNHISYTPTTAYFTAKASLPWLHVSDVSTTAVVLEALLSTQQPFTQAPQTVAWLLTQLNAQGHWNSTSENAAVLGALETYYRTAESQTPDFDAHAFFNGDDVLSSHFAGKTFTPQTATFPFGSVYKKGNQLRVKLAKSGTGMLYYTLMQTYLPERYDTPVNAGFEVSRQLSSLTGEPVTELVAGQRYQVTVTVRTATPRHFVVVEDYPAAGMEVIHTDLATSQRAVPSAQDNDSFSRIERYEERIAAFAHYLPAGTHTFTYQVSALSAGTFAYPSAWASLMYEPAVFGRTASSELIIH